MSKVLTFGRFKGKTFEETPQWYQQWLLKQDWFTKPQAQDQPLHKQLHGWDGHSRKGQAIYDQMFKQEMEEAEKHDPSDRYGFYEGID